MTTIGSQEVPCAICGTINQCNTISSSSAFGSPDLDLRPPETQSMVLQVPKDFGGTALVTPELVAHCHAHAIQVHVWTINEESEIRELLALGVDGIVTDEPGRMARMLADPGPEA